MIRTGVLLALLAAVLAVGGWIYLHPPAKTSGPSRLSALVPDAAQKVRIELPDKQPIMLEKGPAGWRLTAPFAARAETHLVDAMLSVLEAIPRAELPAQHLARFGLATPRAVITIDGERFAWGSVNPVTNEIYVLKGGRVYVLAPRYADALPHDADFLISRSVLAPNEVPVGFTFPQFAVKLKNGIWQLTPPNGNLSEDDLVRWVDAWRNASALRVQPYAGPPPANAIQIELRGGRDVPVGVTEQDGELVLTRFDEHMRYYLFANSARHLLSPPAARSHAQ